MLQSDVMNSDDNESDEFEASGEVGDEKTARDVEQTWVMARISSATSILPAVVQTGRALTGRLQTWIASQLPDTVAG